MKLISMAGKTEHTIKVGYLLLCMTIALIIKRNG